jgi:hypothetical protein
LENFSQPPYLELLSNPHFAKGWPQHTPFWNNHKQASLFGKCVDWPWKNSKHVPF